VVDQLDQSNPILEDEAEQHHTIVQSESKKDLISAKEPSNTITMAKDRFTPGIV
jgi:hypothetical protein